MLRTSRNSAIVVRVRASGEFFCGPIQLVGRSDGVGRRAAWCGRDKTNRRLGGSVTAVSAMRPDSTRLQSIYDGARAAQFTTIPAPPGGDWMTHESRDPIDRRADRVDGGRGALTSPGRHAGQARIRDILSPAICHRTQPETTLNKHFGIRPMDEQISARQSKFYLRYCATESAVCHAISKLS